MSKMTQEQYVEKRVAEGFTVEQAKSEYNRTDTPTTVTLKEKLKNDGKAPTRGEMRLIIHEAIQNNPNRVKVYTPDFSLSKEYKALASKDTSNMTQREKDNLSKQMLHIKINGTISEKTRQAEIDNTLNMPIAQIILQLKNHEAKVADMDERIDNFDLSSIQSKADKLKEQYDKKYIANRGNATAVATLQREYEKEIDELEMELITKPLNDLKLQRYEANEYKKIYDARLKYFVRANEDLIREELVEAKRREIRGSLLNLAGFVEED